MSVHQIIYTSCMRGIHGVNDGQQVFSYDAQFKDANNDSVKSLFSYQPPALGAGVIMTEEIAAAMPKTFIFRKLENGTCALALNTYLGRDYMGSAGRFGNYLSHVVVAEEKEVTVYPCEFYGSSLLRDHMEFEEVNNPNPPQYLPVPVLEKGYVIDIDTVIEFLSVGDRLEIYKNMLYAMLAFERERKRVIICDEPEFIILWIAALEYAVPLKAALGINFTTYEYDPSLSASQICGVVREGTKYTEESKRLHFVFDLYQNDCMEFEKNGEFYDFIDTAFSFSFESIQDFHAFLVNGYDYEAADEELYAAYALYSLLSDGLAGITVEKLKAALFFAQKHASFVEKKKIVQNLLSQREQLLCIDRWMFQDIADFILSMNEVIDCREFDIAKNIIIDKIFMEFFNVQAGEDVFGDFYHNISHMCAQYGFSLATELMQDQNHEKLFAVMKSNIPEWKIAFIVKVISSYAKESNISIIELTPNDVLGNAYYGMMEAIYTQSVQKGFFLVTCILNEFADNCVFLVNMTLNIEGMLLDLQDGSKQLDMLWGYFFQKMASSQAGDFESVYHILYQYARNEQIFLLFNLELDQAPTSSSSMKVFDRHFDNFIRQNKKYAAAYGQEILSLYFNKLNKLSRDNVRTAKLKLFELLMEEKIETRFSRELIMDLLKEVPLQSPSKSNKILIQNAFQYIYNFNRQPVSGKLLWLLIGVVVESIDNCKRVKDKIGQLEELIQNEPADLNELSEKDIRDYFNWILPVVGNLLHKQDEMTMFYHLFKMSEEIERRFFLECTKIYLKKSKDKKDYEIFAVYFGFVCENGDVKIRDDLRKAVCKLNKNRMAELDETIIRIYKTDKQILDDWEVVKQEVETTNPLLNNISNLFRRRR